VFEWLKKLMTPKTSQHGMITRTCRVCGKTFTLPEDVQHWPDMCQECRAKYRPVQPVSRKCAKCGKTFEFSSNERRWPKYCPECQSKKKFF
jgi:DNA-directed RNA polymerase subunit RPC12/RpoP